MADEPMSLNQMLSGYYPGAPVYRRPKSKYMAPPPIEFNDFAKFIDSTVIDLEKNLPVHDRVIKELQEDFSRSLNVTVQPNKAGVLAIPEEQAEGIYEIPGSVAVSLNLDPTAWVKDWRKEAKKFVGEIVKGVTGYDMNSKKDFLGRWDFSDIDSRIEENYLWEPLVSGERVGADRFSGGRSTSFSALESILDKRYGGDRTADPVGLMGLAGPGFEELSTTNKKNTVFVLGEGLAVRSDVNGDSYTPSVVSDARSKFVGSMIAARSPINREAAFTEMGLAFTNMLQADLSAHYSSGWHLSSEVSALRGIRYTDSIGTNSSLLDPFGNDILTANVSKLRDTVGLFYICETNLSTAIVSGNAVDIARYTKEKNELDSDISGLLVQLRGDGSPTNQGILMAYTNALSTLPNVDPNIVTLNDVVTNLSTYSDTSIKANIDTVSNDIKRARNGAFGVMTDEGKRLESFKLQNSLVQGIPSCGKALSSVVSSIDADRLKGISVDLKVEKAKTQKILDDRLEEISRIKTHLSSSGQDKALKEFDRIWRGYEKTLVEIKGTIDRSLTVAELRVNLKTSNSALSNTVLNGGVNDATARKFFNEVYFGNGELGKVFLEQTDLVSFEKSKRLYLMGRNRYEREKAKDVIELIDGGPSKFMEKIAWRVVKNRLGLYGHLSRPSDFFKSNILEATHYFGLVYDAGNDSKYTYGLTGALYSIFKSPIFMSKNIIGFSSGGMSIRVAGGKHLGAAVALGKYATNPAYTPAFWDTILHAKNIADLSSDPTLKGLVLGAKSAEDLTKLIANIDELKRFLYENEVLRAFFGLYKAGGEIKFNAAGLVQFRKFADFLSKRKLSRNFIDPLLKYAGRLQVLSQVLSVFQTKIFNLVLKLRKPWNYIKFLLTEALTDALTGFLASFTGPVAAALRIAINVVVKKAVDWGTSFAKGLLTANFGELYKSIETTMVGLMKYTLWIFFFFVILIMSLSSNGTFLMGVSPVDPLRRNVSLNTQSVCGGKQFEKIKGDLPQPLQEAYSFFTANIKKKLTPDILDVYLYGEQKTGVPCEILAGIHFMEGGNDPNKSLQDGGSLPSGGLKASAEEAGASFKRGLKNPECFGGIDVDASPDAWDKVFFQNVVCALSKYNGGGNDQCDDPTLTNYTLCPRIHFGEDDLYPVNWLNYLNREHRNMSLIYPEDGIKADVFCNVNCTQPNPKPLCKSCPPPFKFERPGALTVAIMVFEGH